MQRSEGVPLRNAAIERVTPTARLPRRDAARALCQDRAEVSDGQVQVAARVFGGSEVQFAPLRVDAEILCALNSDQDQRRTQRRSHTNGRRAGCSNRDRDYMLERPPRDQNCEKLEG